MLTKNCPSSEDREQTAEEARLTGIIRRLEEELARERGPRSKTAGNFNPHAPMGSNSRGLLRGYVAELRQKADALEVLDRAMPLEMPPAAEDAIFSLIMSSRRV